MAAPRPKRSCVRAPGYYLNIIGGRSSDTSILADNIDSESDIDLNSELDSSSDSESEDDSAASGVSDNEEVHSDTDSVMDDGWVRLEDQDPLMPLRRSRVFTENIGPKNMPAQVDGPTTYFELYLTEEFLMGLVLETERYAAQ